jgi:hypothetical protein
VPPESAADVKFEIGHVLFIDIVGYSKLLMTEQGGQIETLKQIVRGTEEFRLAEGRQTAAFADWRWWSTCFPHQSRSAGEVRG